MMLFRSRGKNGSRSGLPGQCLARDPRGETQFTTRSTSTPGLKPSRTSSPSSSYGSHAAGYAASFADPRGRFFYASLGYQFK
jgi:hypothetical protein